MEIQVECMSSIQFICSLYNLQTFYLIKYMFRLGQHNVLFIDRYDSFYTKHLPFSSMLSSTGLAASRPPLFFVGVEGADGEPTSSASTDSLRLSRVTGNNNYRLLI